MRTLMWMPREPEVLGQPTSPTACERLLGHEGHGADVSPGHARHGVQIDAQLVRMVEVLGADRMRVEVEAAEVRDPGQRRRIAQHDLLSGPAGRERERDRVDPLRSLVRGALLEEELARRAVDETLERHRPPASATQRALGDREVVAHEVHLGVPGSGPVDLVGVGDLDLAPPDIEQLELRGHGYASASGTPAGCSSSQRWRSTRRISSVSATPAQPSISTDLSSRFL